MTTPTDPDAPAVAGTTLDHYNRNADAFWNATRDHDVRQNLDALLTNIRGAPPFTILDFGCGPGRDLRTLRDLGHTAIGLDGAENFVAMARAYSGCDVWTQNFIEPDLPAQFFDGVFANASLFHVPAQSLPDVLARLRQSLKPAGILFASNPHGNDEAGWNGGRYGVYHAPATWFQYVTRAGFELVDQYFRPAGLPRAAQPWLATVWRKTAERPP
jgi:SAM-dependent methyltransferase